MINVLIAFTAADLKTIRQNFDRLPGDVQSALSDAKKTRWKQPRRAGKSYVILDAIMRPSWVARIEQQFPDAIVIRAWNPDGSQVGTTKVVDESGDITFTGSPARKGLTNAQLLALMPDDRQGNPQTNLSDAFGHVWFGWGERDYTQ